jgi:hypothetical protein
MVLPCGPPLLHNATVAQRPAPMRDRMPGTIVRLLSSLLVVLLVCSIIYTLMSVGIAITTADKCGSLHTEKHWSYFPPKWECGN